MRSTDIRRFVTQKDAFYKHVMKAMRALADSGDYGFECVPMYSCGKVHVYMFRAIQSAQTSRKALFISFGVKHPRI